MPNHHSRNLKRLSKLLFHELHLAQKEECQKKEEDKKKKEDEIKGKKKKRKRKVKLFKVSVCCEFEHN